MKSLIGPGMLLSIIFLLMTQEGMGQDVANNWPNRGVDAGVGLGSVIAVVASWSRNQSILWAILHGILSWFYVIYFAITREER